VGGSKSLFGLGVGEVKQKSVKVREVGVRKSLIIGFVPQETKFQGFAGKRGVEKSSVRNRRGGTKRVEKKM